MPKFKRKNDLLLWKNATPTTTFALKDRWLTVLPPCGGTLAPIGHKIGEIRLSRGRVIGHYCPGVDKIWLDDWNKYEGWNIIEYSHPIKLGVATTPQVITKPRILKGKDIKYSDNKY